MSVPDEKKGYQEALRFLEFYLGNESYAVELLMVKEVITPPEVTSIPQAPAYVCGMMNLRGLVLTVIDLRKKLGIKPLQDSSETAVIIFDLQDRLVGMMVDSICKVINIDQGAISPIPDSGQRTIAVFRGVLQHSGLLTKWLDPHLVMDDSLHEKKSA